MWPRGRESQDSFHSCMECSAGNRNDVAVRTGRRAADRRAQLGRQMASAANSVYETSLGSERGFVPDGRFQAEREFPHTASFQLATDFYANGSFHPERDFEERFDQFETRSRCEKQAEAENYSRSNEDVEDVRDFTSARCSEEEAGFIAASNPGQMQDVNINERFAFVNPCEADTGFRPQSGYEDEKDFHCEKCLNSDSGLGYYHVNTEYIPEGTCCICEGQFHGGVFAPEDYFNGNEYDGGAQSEGGTQISSEFLPHEAPQFQQRDYFVQETDCRSMESLQSHRPPLPLRGFVPCREEAVNTGSDGEEGNIPELGNNIERNASAGSNFERDRGQGMAGVAASDREKRHCFPREPAGWSRNVSAAQLQDASVPGGERSASSQQVTTTSEDWESCQSSESDEEEERNHRFLFTGLKDELRAKLFQNQKKFGIPRQQGHYRLNTQRMMTEKPDLYYQGQHWVIKGLNTTLERSNKKLTIQAVKREVEREQIQRVNRQQRFPATRWNVPQLKQINEEFCLLMHKSKRHNMLKKKLVQTEQANLKERMHEELQAKHHRMENQKATEAQRRWKMAVLQAQQKCKLKRAVVQEIATAHDRLRQVQEELVCAAIAADAARKEEEAKSMELMEDTKSRVLLQLRRKFLQKGIQKAVEKERCNQNMACRRIEPKMWERKKKVLEELLHKYHQVVAQEKQKEKEAIEKQQNIKTAVLEDLLHNYWRMKTSEMAAQEKARRIMEVEKCDKHSKQMELMKNMWRRVQAEMMIERFKGRIHSKKVGEPEVTNIEETPYDEKLRRIRQGVRKQAIYVLDNQEN